MPPLRGQMVRHAGCGRIHAGLGMIRLCTLATHGGATGPARPDAAGQTSKRRAGATSGAGVKRPGVSKRSLGRTHNVPSAWDL